MLRRLRGWVPAAPVCVLVAALLSGCAKPGPNYSRPPLTVPQQFRFDNTAQAESIADVPWWQFFDDPYLQALIREAIAGNLDLRAAIARVEQARAQAGIARSFLYPRVDGVAEYEAFQHTGSDLDGVQHGGRYGLAVAWEADLFGRIRRESEAAYAELLATDQGRRGVLVTLVGDVASNYFLLRELDNALAISRSTLAVNDRTVTFFTDRLQGGVSNRLEVDRIRANRAQTAAAVPDIERRIATVENLICLLLGRPPGPIAREAAELVPTAAPALPPGLPAALLERRPDVAEAEQLLVAANADIGAAKALFFPNISLNGFLGGANGVATLTLGGLGFLWSTGAQLLQPVYQGGRLTRNLEAARARFDEALAQYRKAALNGYREVSDALVTIQKLAEARVERQSAVVSLQDAAELARARYDAGLANYLEILTADQELFQEQLLLAQNLGAEFRARADLYRALGGGWQL